MKLWHKILVVAALGVLIYGLYHARSNKNYDLPVDNGGRISYTYPTGPTSDPGKDDKTKKQAITVVAMGLDTPWAIVFLPADSGTPEGSMLITERKGTLRLFKDGKLQDEPVATINSRELGEGGLLGIALHPDFTANRFLYLYYTYGASDGRNLNRVSRFTYKNEKLSDEKVIMDGIAASANHDGGRIKFGPDKMLYVTVGDAQDPSKAQDINSLSGKILRITDEGSPAPGNPFGNPVYSYGHRNPQGLAWDKNGQLWETEHGPSGVQTGNDEFNRIDPGKNYGWPEIKGKQILNGMETPILESGFLNTWAPSGLAYLNGKFYFAGLKGEALYEVDPALMSLKTHFKAEFGRLREVVVGPDNMLYVTTSNLDGRGTAKEGDDKILRIDPQKL